MWDAKFKGGFRPVLAFETNKNQQNARWGAHPGPCATGRGKASCSRSRDWATAHSVGACAPNFCWIVV